MRSWALALALAVILAVVVPATAFGGSTVLIKTLPNIAVVKTGSVADIEIRIESGGQPVAAYQIELRLDQRFVEFVDLDPGQPGIQPKLGNCPMMLQDANAPQPNRAIIAAVTWPGVSLSCTTATVRVKGIQMGTSPVLYKPGTLVASESMELLPFNMASSWILVW